MILENQSAKFSIPKHVTYLNTAALSPIFKSVEQAGITSVINKSKAFNISQSHFFEPVTKLKKQFTRLIEADDYNRIANIPSVSYGIATVTNNITLNKDDEIILIDKQFPSNYLSWKKLAQTYQAKLIIIKQPDSQTNQGQLWNQAILNAITNRTAVVAMGHIHWITGTIFNLEAIRKKTITHKALLIIDGSQSIGVLPFSVKKIQPDALICAGYKWLFGPYGSALAYYGPYFDKGNPIEENWSNRLHSENFSNLNTYEPNYKPLANRYSAGEHASFIYVNMLNAALKQIIEWTPMAIQNYCKSISNDAVIQLRNLGCYIQDDAYRAHHLFGILLPDTIDKTGLKKRLENEHIHISFRGNYIRVSCHLFNNKAHFNKLVNCISNHL